MDEMAKIVIASIITAIVSNLVASLPKLIMKYNTTISKQQSIKIAALAVIKYAFFIALIFLCFWFVPFSKWFVFSMFCISTLFTFFIARDVFYYLMFKVLYVPENEKTKKEIADLFDEISLNTTNEIKKRKMAALKLKMEALK